MSRVLYTTLFLLPVTDKPDVELALHTCYNRWVADIWSKGEGRLRWAALLPYMLMDRALEEMHGRSSTAPALSICAVWKGTVH